jgi:hypothetical protein
MACLASGRLYCKGHANFSAVHMPMIFNDFLREEGDSRATRSETSESAHEPG